MITIRTPRLNWGASLDYKAVQVALDRSIDFDFVGIVPGTDLMRHASTAQKLYARYFLHGIFRFVKLTKTVSQAANYICTLATDEKFKGKRTKCAT